jgi:hypothetical protein
MRTIAENVDVNDTPERSARLLSVVIRRGRLAIVGATVLVAGVRLVLASFLLLLGLRRT